MAGPVGSGRRCLLGSYEPQREPPIDLTAAVLTVSDGVADGSRRDDTGDAVAARLAAAAVEVVDRRVVSDDVEAVAAAVRDLAGRVRLVVTNGGTGLGPRDVTPEAVLAVVDRSVPGFGEAMRAAGRARTPLADLSRSLAGAVGETLVVALPGSPAGAVDSLDAVLAIVGHAVELLAGHTRHAGDVRDHEHAHTHPPDPGGERADTPGDQGVAAGADPVAVLAERTAAGEPTVVVTVVRLDGRPPSSLGRKLVLGPGGPVAGTLGCSEFDAEAAALADEVLAAAEPALRTLHHDLGTVDVIVEPHGPRDRLVVCGATPVAAWLLRWATDLGYRTALVDRREDRLRALGAAASASGSRIEDIGVDGHTDVVHTDHDAPGVAEDLAAAVRGGARFVGVMGSRRHAGRHLRELAALGLDEDEIESITSPVGFRIGGDAPEIALGILAGIVAARTGARGGATRGATSGARPARR